MKYLPLSCNSSDLSGNPSFWFIIGRAWHKHAPRKGRKGPMYMAHIPLSLVKIMLPQMRVSLLEGPVRNLSDSQAFSAKCPCSGATICRIR